MDVPDDWTQIFAAVDAVFSERFAVELTYIDNSPDWDMVDVSVKPPWCESVWRPAVNAAPTIELHRQAYGAANHLDIAVALAGDVLNRANTTWAFLDSLMPIGHTQPLIDTARRLAHELVDPVTLDIPTRLDDHAKALLRTLNLHIEDYDRQLDSQPTMTADPACVCVEQPAHIDPVPDPPTETVEV
jgi:hypothetical protein